MGAVSARQITKEFPVGDRSIRVLHDISLDIASGGITMIVGPSGCGKTTLISILTGILSQTAGSVRLLNTDLNSLSDREKVIFRREHIGFIFQQYNLLPALTAAENAAMPLLAAGMPRAQAVEKARTILARIGMQDQTEKLPRQLSGGQQQRVAIARALVHEPEIIVCDEPTAALDAQTGQTVMEILRDLARDERRAIIIVTHDNRIYRFADRILDMEDGRIIGDHTSTDYNHKE